MQTPSQNRQLTLNLARSINEREETILELKNHALQQARSVIAECVLQGQELIEAKSRVPSNAWDNWMAAHIPKTAALSERYIKLASNVEDPDIAEIEMEKAEMLAKSSTKSGLEKGMHAGGDPGRNTPDKTVSEDFKQISKVLGVKDEHIQKYGGDDWTPKYGK